MCPNIQMALNTYTSIAKLSKCKLLDVSQWCMFMCMDTSKIINHTLANGFNSCTPKKYACLLPATARFTVICIE